EKNSAQFFLQFSGKVFLRRVKKRGVCFYQYGAVPSVPFVKIDKLPGFLQNLFFSGIEVILKEILLEKILTADLPVLFRLSLPHIFLRLLYDLMEIVRIHRLQDIIRHSVP